MHAIVRAVAIGVSGLLTVAGCSSEPSVGTNALPPAPVEERVVFVTLGGDETLNFGLEDTFRTAWPRLVFAELPTSAVYVNLATEGATVATGNDVQAEEALDLQPTLATVWFGSGDLRGGTTDASFTAELTELATRLRDGGAEVLLVSNTNSPSSARFSPLIDDVAERTGTTHVEVPGSPGDQSDPSVQEDVAAAVLAAIEN